MHATLCRQRGLVAARRLVLVGTFALGAIGAGAACGGRPAPKAPPPASPPGVSCTEIGCVDGLHLELSPSAAWPTGRYRFVVVADQRTTVCEGAIPLLPCEQGPSVRCDQPGVQIGESGCALPAEQHGFSSIDLQAGPQSVTVTIERDGRTVANRAFTPAYRESRPNGPQCEPVCRQASEVLPLAEP